MQSHHHHRPQQIQPKSQLDQLQQENQQTSFSLTSGSPPTPITNDFSNSHKKNSPKRRLSLASPSTKSKGANFSNSSSALTSSSESKNTSSNSNGPGSSFQSVLGGTTTSRLTDRLTEQILADGNALVARVAQTVTRPTPTLPVLQPLPMSMKMKHTQQMQQHVQQQAAVEQQQSHQPFAQMLSSPPSILPNSDTSHLKKQVMQGSRNPSLREIGGMLIRSENDKTNTGGNYKNSGNDDARVKQQAKKIEMTNAPKKKSTSFPSASHTKQSHTRPSNSMHKQLSKLNRGNFMFPITAEQKTALKSISPISSKMANTSSLLSALQNGMPVNSASSQSPFNLYQKNRHQHSLLQQQTAVQAVDKTINDTNVSNSEKSESSLPSVQTSLVNETNSKIYEATWNKIVNMKSSQLLATPIARRYRCEAERQLHHGQSKQPWMAVLTLPKGLSCSLGSATGNRSRRFDLGRFHTKKEAIKRSVCTAMMLDYEDTEKKASEADIVTASKKSTGTEENSAADPKLPSPIYNNESSNFDEAVNNNNTLRLSNSHPGFTNLDDSPSLVPATPVTGALNNSDNIKNDDGVDHDEVSCSSSTASSDSSSSELARAAETVVLASTSTGSSTVLKKKKMLKRKKKIINDSSNSVIHKSNSGIQKIRVKEESEAVSEGVTSSFNNKLRENPLHDQHDMLSSNSNHSRSSAPTYEKTKKHKKKDGRSITLGSKSGKNGNVSPGCSNNGSKQTKHPHRSVIMSRMSTNSSHGDGQGEEVVLATFKNCTLAEKETNICRGRIGKVCRTGGGIVDGFHFKFSSSAGKKIPGSGKKRKVSATSHIANSNQQEVNSIYNQKQFHQAAHHSQLPHHKELQLSNLPNVNGFSTTASPQEELLPLDEPPATFADPTMKKRKKMQSLSSKQNCGEQGLSTTAQSFNTSPKSLVTMKPSSKMSSEDLAQTSSSSGKQKIPLPSSKIIQGAGHFGTSQAVTPIAKRPNTASQINKSTATSSTPEKHLNKSKSKRKTHHRSLPTQSNIHQIRNLKHVFDVTSLKPLPYKEKQLLKRKKIIELVDKLSGAVLVCFRGMVDAGMALGIDRKKIGMACRPKGKNDGNDKKRVEDFSFPMYSVRFASHSAAYEYGKYSDDYKKKSDETQEECFTRWQSTIAKQAIEDEQNQEYIKEKDRKKVEICAATPGNSPAGCASISSVTRNEKTSSALQTSSAVPNVALVVNTPSLLQNQHKMANISDPSSNISSRTTTTMGKTLSPNINNLGKPSAVPIVNNSQKHPTTINNNISSHKNDSLHANKMSRSLEYSQPPLSLPLTLSPPPIVATMNTKSFPKTKLQGYATACIMCQNQIANIVFEPCQHCVLCIHCVERGFCRSFCPICRIPIRSRSQPSRSKIIRPRIFSAHSFMMY